jgi:uncharacterized protein (TIGR03083 family)
MYRSWLADEGQAFEAALNLDPTTAVPTCPGWTLTDLVAHVGSYHRWVADLLHDRSPAPRSPYQLRPDPNVSLASWYRTSLELLLTAIDTTDQDTTMWTVTLDQKAGAWHRRQAHDLTIHRWDARNAGGATQPILAERAADFIDELFGRALPYIVPFVGRVTPDSSLALRSTDRHFARLIHGDSGRPRLSHKSGPADATLTGTCSDLLLAVWRRPNAVTVTGNPAVLTEWQQAVDG